MISLQGVSLVEKTISPRRWFLGIACGVIALLVSSFPAHAQVSARMQWDIATLDTTGTILSAGGTASAEANDGSKITLSAATGMFRTLPGSARFSAIGFTGSGSWTTFDSTGAMVASGTFTQRRGPAFFAPVTGSLPSGIVTDNIGAISDARAGFLIVEVKYSDGDKGVLVIACKFTSTPAATTDSPLTAFEGVIATKGSTEYLDIGSGAITVFHIAR